jgi:hypothetical protein
VKILHQILIFSFIFTALSCPDKSWILRGDRCYNFGKNHTNFATAKDICKKLNSEATLVVIDDSEENGFLKQFSTEMVNYGGAGFWDGYYLGY